jgi:hypothetical protein
VPVAVRAWLRYLVPLTILSAIACAPILLVALRAPAVKDIEHARQQIRIAWVLGSFAWVCQLWLVAGVAPAVKSVARAQPMSQLAALGAGIRGLVRGVLPVGIAVIAILLGGLALAVPGVLLLALLSLTGASDKLREPPPAPLVDSITAVRGNWRHVAIVLGAIIVVTLAVVFVAQHAIVPLIKAKVAPSKLLPIHRFIRVVGLAIAGGSSLAACALASLYRRS